MVGYRRCPLTLHDPHELRSCGASDGRLPRASHLHAALCTEADTAPLEIAFCYQNNLAHLLRLGRDWSSGFYVGTFGEYSMQAVRNRLPAP